MNCVKFLLSLISAVQNSVVRHASRWLRAPLPTHPACRTRSETLEQKIHCTAGSKKTSKCYTIETGTWANLIAFHCCVFRATRCGACTINQSALVVVSTVSLHRQSKNMPLNFCLYLRQILTDFKNSFTITVCGKFAVTRSLNIPPYLYCVTTLPCEI